MPSRLLLMGDGPDRSQAEWLVGKKGLRKHVEFMGKVDRVSEKLSIADLMLMPSQMESFGLAALEGMACEVPAIATSVGGVPEVIEHGRTGFLAQVGDVDTMARCAIDILSDEKRLREMGMLARWEAQSRYCSTKIIPEYEDFTNACWSARRKCLAGGIVLKDGNFQHHQRALTVTALYAHFSSSPKRTCRRSATFNMPIPRPDPFVPQRRQAERSCRHHRLPPESSACRPVCGCEW